MAHRCAMVLWATSLVLCGTAVASATIYHVTDLAPLGGNTATRGMGVATVGGVPQVAGFSYSTQNPVVWANGTPTNLLSSIPGATVGWGWGIAGNGDVVGRATISGQTRAFYLPNGSGTATVLPVLDPANAYSTGTGVNSSGQVVGSSKATDGNYHAYTWTNAGGIVDLGALPGAIPSSGSLSTASGVSSTGNVAGMSYDSTGFYYAVKWAYDGTNWTITNMNSNLGTSPCKGASAGYAVNAAGDVVGYGWTQGGISLNRDAFLFKHDGTVVKIGSFANPWSGVPQAYAESINNNGWIVGYSEAPGPAGSGNHAFISDGTTNSVQDLNGMIAPDGSGTNWSLQYAYGIDDAGHITGYGTVGGATHGYLLTPVLPGDTDENGSVDINDLSKVLTNYNKTAMTWADGNFDGSGTVSLSDLSAVLTNYGKSSGTGAAAKAVPEPGTLLLLATSAGGALICVWRRRG